jgi:hypothetical protein
LNKWPYQFPFCHFPPLGCFETVPHPQSQRQSFVQSLGRFEISEHPSEQHGKLIRSLFFEITTTIFGSLQLALLVLASKDLLHRPQHPLLHPHSHLW